MNYTWGDVSLWIVILILFWGIFLAGLRARDWWRYEKKREEYTREARNR
jgi:hypothetical protein